MNEKIITFSAHPIIMDDKELHPEPARVNIPEWYKKTPNPTDHTRLTIKACKPFLDTLTAGYILKNTIDQKINFNVPGPDGKLNTWVRTRADLDEFDHNSWNINFNKGHEVHPIEQIGGMACPFAKQNKGFPIYKISNPWLVTVPKGYSVLYLPPINRPNDRFEIIPGIVDGPMIIPTNFPIVFKKEGTWVLKKGEPVATVFPFKKESWKMEIKTKDPDKHTSNLFRYASYLRRFYEDKIWNKVRWK